MPTGLAVALAGGLFSALFYLPLLAGGAVGALILGYLAPLPLLAAGLSAGAAAAAIGGVFGSLLVLAGSGSALVGATFALTAAVPAWLLVHQALKARQTDDGQVEWYPAGRLLSDLTAMGIAAFGLAVLLAQGEPEGLQGVVRGALGEMAQRLTQAEGDGAAAPEGVAFTYAAAMPAMVVISWLLMTIVNATLAQGVLMRFGRQRRPGMRVSDLALPRWLAPAFGATLALALFAPDPVGFLGLNLCLILALPLAFAGLSVVHAFARSRSARTPILVGFYVSLLLFGWPIAVTVGLGVIEQWLELRRRWPAAPPQEDK